MPDLGRNVEGVGIQSKKASEANTTTALSVQTSAKPCPTVPELLATYKTVMDRYRSFIYATESFCLDKTTKWNSQIVNNQEVASTLHEYRTDGSLFFECKQMSTAFLRPRVFIPHDRKSKTWLWDGKYFYLYRRKSERYARQFAVQHVGVDRREQFIQTAIGNLHLYLNSQDPKIKQWIVDKHPGLPGYAGVYRALKDAKQAVIHDKRETIDGSECYVIDLAVKPGIKHRYWLDPIHDYLIAKSKTWFQGRMFCETLRAKFESHKDIWLATQVDCQYSQLQQFCAAGTYRTRLTRFQLRPDHKALDSFGLGFMEGAVVHLSGADESELPKGLVWQNGHVVDARGQAVDLE